MQKAVETHSSGHVREHSYRRKLPGIFISAAISPLKNSSKIAAAAFSQILTSNITRK